jgi:hypothetical protein
LTALWEKCIAPVPQLTVINQYADTPFETVFVAFNPKAINFASAAFCIALRR